MHTVLALFALGNLLEHEPHASAPFGRAETHTLWILADHAIVSGGLPEGGECLQAVTVERDGACRRHALPFLGLRPQSMEPQRSAIPLRRVVYGVCGVGGFEASTGASATLTQAQTPCQSRSER